MFDFVPRIWIHLSLWSYFIETEELTSSFETSQLTNIDQLQLFFTEETIILNKQRNNHMVIMMLKI